MPFRVSAQVPQTVRHPACFPGLLAPNKDREIGGGRATRQPGQVRKEAALTRSGSGRSSVSYLFFRANRARSAVLRWIPFRRVFRKGGYRFCDQNTRKQCSASRFRETINCGSIDDRRWQSRRHPHRSRKRPSGRVRSRRPAAGGQALPGAGAQIPPLQFRRPDRPGGHGPHRFECVRDRPDSAGLDPDRRARRRQDHHRANSRPRAELRVAGRIGEGTDHPHAGARRALPGDHGKPAHGRAGNGRRLPYRRRRRAPDQRQRALRAGQRALQGLHHRRSPHALDRGLQRLPEDAGRAAGACQIRVRHHRNPQSAGHGAVALPAVRPAPGRCRRADGASCPISPARKTSRSSRRRSASSRARRKARCAIRCRCSTRRSRMPRARCAPTRCGRCSASPTAPGSSICSIRWRAAISPAPSGNFASSTTPAPIRSWCCPISPNSSISSPA